VIRGVIFDLGSTLIGFDGDWTQVLEEGLRLLIARLREEGFAIDGEAFAAAYREASERYQQQRQVDHRERTTALVVREVMAGFGYATVSEATLRAALELMYAPSEAQWHPMPGVAEVLADLRRGGYRLALVSNASDEANARRLIDKAGLRVWFDPILISAAVGVRKPAPEVFRRVLREWKAPAREVAMVGDSLAEDILGAQHAGLHSLWLTTAADTPANRANAASVHPEIVVENLYQLPVLIRSLDGRLARG
jgi:HAD superfamily hydrolase (TIGR01662 family)